VQEAQANSNDHLQKHVTILTHVSVKLEEDGNVNMKKAKAKIKKVIKGLKKASKTHAAQAKTLKGVIRGTRANTK
jgi:hypothetical protein